VSQKPLKEPLLKEKYLPKDLEPVAVQVFKNIVSFTGDRASSKKPLGHMNKIGLAGEGIMIQTGCRDCLCLVCMLGDGVGSGDAHARL